jgi:hypothetical protein
MDCLDLRDGKYCRTGADGRREFYEFPRDWDESREAGDGVVPGRPVAFLAR